MGSRKFLTVMVVALVGVLACGALLVGCGNSSSKSTSAKSTSASASATSTTTSKSTTTSVIQSVDSSDPYASGTHHAVVTVEGYDPFTIELDADDAPISVSNFCSLANDGYYNGLTFYRFENNFCMQGGTKGNSASGKDTSLKKIKGEFSGNGVDNKLADNFDKGVVAMARSQDPNSASSTFFVTLGDAAKVGQSLNGQYAAFGKIDEAGMAIVDQIVADYLPNATGNMGVINDESKQAKIKSIEITD